MSNTAMTSPGKRLVAKFGGITSMARALDYPTTTVQRWAESGGTIRSSHYPAILDAAVKRCVKLEIQDFIDIDTSHPAFRSVHRR